MRSGKTLFLLLLPAVWGAAFLLSYHKISCWDVFWHLKSGQVILEQGRLLDTNFFSSSYPDHPWPNPEWLFQVAIAWLHGGGGWEALTFLKVLLAVLTGSTLFLTAFKVSRLPALSASLAVLSLCAMQFRFSERPHLFSYLFMGLAVLLMESSTRDGKGLRWLLVPLFLIWSNIHPELIVGLFYVAAFLLGEHLDAPRRPEGFASGLKAPAALLLLCLLATVANPEGHHVLVFPFLHLFLGPVIDVTEYTYSSFREAPLFWATAVPLWVFLARPSQRRWREILPLAGLTVFGVLYLRSTPYFFLAGTPVIAARVAENIPGTPFLTRARVGALSLLAACASLTWALGYERLVPYRWGSGLHEELYPAAAAGVILEENLPAPLYHGYAEGAYLIHRLFPRYGVFQDGRVQAYPRDFVARLHSRFSLEDWPGLLDEYGVQTALVRIKEMSELFPRSAWAVIYWDDRWAVLLRRGKGQEEHLERLEYRRFYPGVDPLLVDGEEAFAEMAAEMRRNQASRGSPSALVARDLGLLYLRFGLLEEARRALEESLAVDPGLEDAARLLRDIAAGTGGVRE